MIMRYPINKLIQKKFVSRLAIVWLCCISTFTLNAHILDTIPKWEYQVITKFADNIEASKKAKTVIDSALKAGHIFQKFTKEDLIKVPFIIKKEFNNTEYLLCINSIKIRTNNILLELFGRICNKRGDTLLFGTPEAKFSGSGGIFEDFKLGLLHDYSFDIAKNKARVTLKQITDIGGCFISFDCDGFKELALAADAQLSREWVVPVDQFGKPQNQGRVTTAFSTRIFDFNDWTVNISLPDFALTSYDKMSFSIKEAILDCSDVYNDPSMKFPPGYFDEPEENEDGNPSGLNQTSLLGMTEPSGTNNNNEFHKINTNDLITNDRNNNQKNDTDQKDETWRGFYIKYFKVTLPKEFLKRGDSTRLYADAENLLIDSKGVTGECSIHNIITLDEGRMQTWAYSLDEASILLIKSKLAGFELNGKIELPIAEEKQTLGYSGAYNKYQKNFVLKVSLEDKIQFPIWHAAEVTLEKCSYAKITVQNQQFFPYVNLSGSMYIRSDEKELDAPGVIFEELQLATYSPFINIKSLSLAKEVKLKGTPLTINELGISKDKELFVLYMNADANMEGEKESGIQASLGVKIFGLLSEENNKHKLKFDHFEIADGSISGKFPGFEFYGSFRPFTENPEYGTGYEAELFFSLDLKGDAKSESGSNKTFSFKIDAYGIFGNKNGMRYWAVDAGIEFSPCITLSAVSLCGFSGGAYRHMTLTANGAQPGKIGVTRAGNVYTPKQSVGLGIRAGVLLTFSGSKSLSGSALIQFEFSEGGGLQKVFFEGSVELQVNLDKVPGLTKVVGKIAKYANYNLNDGLAQMRNANKSEIDKDCKNTAKAVFTLNLEFDKNRYSAALDFTINLLGGVLTGYAHSEILADFGNKKFHFYLGTCTEPIRVSANMNAVKIDVFAYLMFGNDIPGFPKLNPRIANLLQVNENQLQANASKDMNYVENGAGMLFGAGVQIKADKCVWLIVCIRGKTSFDAGFDAGFLKFDSSKRCSNGGGLGIDGWYNMARFYLAISLEAGRHKQCHKKYIKWADLTLGVFLEGQFPNPEYFQGKIFVRVCGYSFTVKVDTGTKCGGL